MNEIIASCIISGTKKRFKNEIFKSSLYGTSDTRKHVSSWLKYEASGDVIINLCFYGKTIQVKGNSDSPELDEKIGLLFSKYAK